MTFLTFVALIAGLALLVAGAEILVKGASNIAKSFGIPSLVVGLTVVAYGTSAPELAVSIFGSVSGDQGVALGNVLGSTISNVLLILGLSAVVSCLVVARRIIRVEVPIMIGLAAFTYLLARDGKLSFIDGTLLIACVVAYTWFTVSSARSDRVVPVPTTVGAGASVSIDDVKSESGLGANLIRILLGLAGLVGGSQLLVGGAVDIATALGLSDVIVGLTVVAVGTSLPELATSIAAVIKGDRDIAVGNIVGSNIFNMSLVLGASSLVAPGGLVVPASVLAFDFPVMLAVCVATLPVFFIGHSLSRWEGGVFVGYYGAYLAYLVLDVSGHSAAQLFGTAMTVFVFPLTVITLAIFVVREIQEIRARKNRVVDLSDATRTRTDVTV